MFDDVPRADSYPATGQKKARAVHHWDVLADDVAARVAGKIAAWPAGEHPIYVTVPDDSSFNQGFLKLLRVRLLDRGVALAPGAYEVLFPGLAHTKDELERVTDIASAAAQEVAANR